MKKEKLWMVCMYVCISIYDVLKKQPNKKVSESTQVKSVWSELSVHVWSANLFDLGCDPKWWPLNSPIPHFRWPKVVATIVLSTHTNTHTHTHGEKERERERESHPHITLLLSQWASQVMGGPKKYRVKEHPPNCSRRIVELYNNNWPFLWLQNPWTSSSIHPSSSRWQYIKPKN
jgi:hypothetical protein